MNIKKNLFSTQRETLGFVSTWDSTQDGNSNNNQILLPLITEGDYDFNIYSNGRLLKRVKSGTESYSPLVEFKNPGIKTINCVGKFQGFNFNFNGDPNKIISIDNFGDDFKMLKGEKTFRNCVNLQYVDDAPNLSAISSLNQFFYRCFNLERFSAAKFDVSKIEDFSEMFFQCFNLQNFNNSNWDFSKATTLFRMYMGCQKITRIPCGYWNISNVINLNQFARSMPNLQDFNVSGLNVEKVTDFSSMLRDSSIPSNFDPSNWKPISAQNFQNFILPPKKLPQSIYSNILKNWKDLPLKSGVKFDAGASQYSSEAAKDKQNITDNYNWVFTDNDNL